MSDEPAALRDVLVGVGLIHAGEAVALTPLTGGVSSEIVRVESAGRVFCVKRALPQLRTAQAWLAPISRNATEAAWLRFAQEVAPGSAPEVLAHAPEHGVFAMEYLGPPAYAVWKEALLEGDVRSEVAAQVGDTLAALHRHAAGRTDLAKAFDNDTTFDALRLDPYFGWAGLQHGDLAVQLHWLSAQTRFTRTTLIHGDVSPKNILVGEGRVVFLDAECATYGDPAFDAAFCLSHLVLKAIHRPAAHTAYVAAGAAFWDRWLGKADWEARDGLVGRVSALVGGLLLARVDGKSPVEYLDEAGRGLARALGRRGVLKAPADPLDHFDFTAQDVR